MKLLKILGILIVKKSGKYPNYKMNYYNPLTYVFISIWCLVILPIEGIRGIFEWLKILKQGKY